MPRSDPNPRIGALCCCPVASREELAMMPELKNTSSQRSITGLVQFPFAYAVAHRHELSGSAVATERHFALPSR